MEPWGRPTNFALFQLYQQLSISEKYVGIPSGYTMEPIGINSQLTLCVRMTYETANRIGMQIRWLMGALGFDGLPAGHIQANKANVVGRRSGRKRGRGALGTTIDMGMRRGRKPILIKRFYFMYLMS